MPETQEPANSAHLRLWNPKILAIVLISKLAVLFFASQTYQINTNKGLGSIYGYLKIWVQWDAKHYLNLAQNGYVSAGEDRFLLVFFPLFPALTAVANVVFNETLISAFFVTTIASFFVAVFLFELAKFDFSAETALKSVFFLFIFPTAYFLHIPYTESLFLALCLGAFYFARRRKWYSAGAFGLFAGLTRINGLFLIPAMAFEVWAEYRETRRINNNWFGLLLTPVGFIGYLALNQYISGSATTFLTYQREHWQKYMRVPWESFWETLRTIAFDQNYEAVLMRGFHEALFAVIGLIAIVFGWRYLRASYRVWMVLNWLIFVSTSFLLSVPRYTLILFPLFFLIAGYSNRNYYFRIFVIIASLLYQALFITQFVRGWWAF